MTREEDYVAKESEVSRLGYKDLGWDNGRLRQAPEQAECQQSGHRKAGLTFDVQGNARGSKNIYGCNECRWFAYYDCSD